MPTTPRLGLVYPVLSDDPDVPDDIRKLALSVENAAIGWVAGDFKFSFQGGDHDQFIKCDGIPRTRASLPAAYNALIDAVLTPHPDPTKVRTPDFRRRSPIGADPAGAALGGVVPNLGALGGEETHLLTALESGVNPNGSTTAAGNHAHDFQGQREDVGGTNDSVAPKFNTGQGVNSTFWSTQGAGAHGHNLNSRNANNPHNVVGPYLAGNWFIATGGGGSGTGGGGGGPTGVGGLVALPAGVRTNVIHDLATNFVTITVWDVTSGLQADAEAKIEDANTISLLSAAARNVNVVITPVVLPLP